MFDTAVVINGGKSDFQKIPEEVFVRFIGPAGGWWSVLMLSDNKTWFLMLILWS